MNRVLEPELMTDPDQANAYAAADFATVNQSFVDRFRALFPDFARGRMVDLGCGPADIPIRFCRTLPAVTVTGVDGSEAMLAPGRRAVATAGLAARVTLVRARLPGLDRAPGGFHAVVSNSLVHHMPHPDVFWSEVARLGRAGAPALIMDLHRPDSPERARAMDPGTKRVWDSAQYLAVHFHEVPVMLIPCHKGRPNEWGGSRCQAPICGFADHSVDCWARWCWPGLRRSTG